MLTKSVATLLKNKEECLETAESLISQVSQCSLSLQLKQTAIQPLKEIQM